MWWQFDDTFDNWLATADFKNDDILADVITYNPLYHEYAIDTPDKQTSFADKCMRLYTALMPYINDTITLANGNNISIAWSLFTIPCEPAPCDNGLRYKVCRSIIASAIDSCDLDKKYMYNGKKISIRQRLYQL